MITADTNLFVYTIDPRDALKQATARRIVRRMREGGASIALQVIGEFQNAAIRKLKTPRRYVAQYAAGLLQSFQTFPASRSAADFALVEMSAGRLSYWDALMLASAAEAGCAAMLSEDMQDGATLFGLEIVNPFAATGGSLRATELLGLA